MKADVSPPARESYDLFCVDEERLYELVENKDTGKCELMITDLQEAG